MLVCPTVRQSRGQFFGKNRTTILTRYALGLQGRITAGILVCLAGRAGAQKINLPPVTRTKLDNGAQVVLMEYHKAPVLVVSAVFAGGDSVDVPEKAGVATLTATLLRKGTEKRTAPQIAEEIEFLGGSLGVSSGTDRLAASLNVQAKDADAGLELLTDILRHPTFPAEELERERQLELAAIQALGENPSSLADYVVPPTVFAGHPYGLTATATTLKAITAADVRSYYKKVVVPNRMIIVAVGDFKSAEMLAKLKARFGDWTPTPDSLPAVPKVSASPRKLLLIDKGDATQTQVRLVRFGFPRSSADYDAAQVANAILGGGFTSRLTDEIRVNRSLTYGINSRFGTNRMGGDFLVATFTKIETTRALLDATNSVLKKAAQGLTAQELQKVKGFLAGQFAIRVQTPEALAGQLVDIAFNNLPPNYLETYLVRLRAITLEQANRIARTYFAPDAMSVVLVAPAAKVKGQLNGFGTFEVRPAEQVGR